MEQTEETLEHSDPTSGIPTGTTYHLNSKRLKTRQLRRIATALGLAGNASAEDTRRMIEGKLRELDREPVDVQVIVPDADGDGMLYLIDDEGIILTVEAIIDSHVTGDEIANSRSALRRESGSRSPTAESNELEAVTEELRQARLALEEEKQRSAAQMAELTALRESLAKEKQKVKRMWREKCEQLLTHEDEQDTKDAEIRTLKAELARLQGHSSGTLLHGPEVTPTGSATPIRRLEYEVNRGPSGSRVGKAPPIDTFTGESVDVLWEDWLPLFERAAHWNGWTEEEKLLQIAGYFRRKALQEWNLLSETHKSSYTMAVREMQTRLDPGSKVMAAQDFRHTIQDSKESVSDFIRRLEQVFRRAYGKEQISAETRATLLHGQLQEGLNDALMRSPAVSGALTYQELCAAAKNEERRQKDLSKRRLYHREGADASSPGGAGNKSFQGKSQQMNRKNQSTGAGPSGGRTCYICNSKDHIMKECPACKTKSSGNSYKASKKATAVRQTQGSDTELKKMGVSAVTTHPGTEPSAKPPSVTPLDFLLSDSEEEIDTEVKAIRVSDGGSKSQCV